jgi:hypothetical protein
MFAPLGAPGSRKKLTALARGVDDYDISALRFLVCVVFKALDRLNVLVPVKFSLVTFVFRVAPWDPDDKAAP